MASPVLCVWCLPTRETCSSGISWHCATHLMMRPCECVSQPRRQYTSKAFASACRKLKTRRTTLLHLIRRKRPTNWINGSFSAPDFAATAPFQPVPKERSGSSPHWRANPKSRAGGFFRPAKRIAMNLRRQRIFAVSAAAVFLPGCLTPTGNPLPGARNKLSGHS